MLFFTIFILYTRSALNILVLYVFISRRRDKRLFKRAALRSATFRWRFRWRATESNCLSKISELCTNIVGLCLSYGWLQLLLRTFFSQVNI